MVEHLRGEGPRGAAPDRAKGRFPWPSLLLVVCLAATAIGYVTLHSPTPLEVTSGSSMLPTIRTGELAIIQGVPTRALHVGQIVAVQVPINDQVFKHYPPIILHRIYRIEWRHGQEWLKTKGDNQGPDPFWVPVSAIGGRLVVAIPVVGYLLLYLKSMDGLIGLGGLLVLYLLYRFLVFLTVLAARESEETTAPSPAPARGADASSAGVLDTLDELIRRTDEIQETLSGLKTTATRDGGSTPAIIRPTPNLDRLVMAIETYGAHLQSHTAVVMRMAESAALLEEAARHQNAILERLSARLEVPIPMRPPAPSRDPLSRVARRRGTRGGWNWRRPPGPVKGGTDRRE
jgi:signal peptidase I